MSLYSINYITNNIVNGYVSIKLKESDNFRKNIINTNILNIL